MIIKSYKYRDILIDLKLYNGIMSDNYQIYKRKYHNQALIESLGDSPNKKDILDCISLYENGSMYNTCKSCIDNILDKKLIKSYP